MYQRTAFGLPKEEWEHTHIHDIHGPEWLAWTPLLALIVVLGLFPGLLFNLTDGAVHTVTAAFSQSVGCQAPVTVSLLLAAAAPQFKVPNLDYHALLPEIILSVVIAVILLLDLFLDETQKYLLPSVGGIGLLSATGSVVELAAHQIPRR